MLFRRGGGTPDHVINTDATEGDGNRSFGFGQRGPDDFIYQRRARLQRIDLVHCGCCTQDIVRRNAIAFPSQLVTSIRAPNSPQDAIAHQRLQYGSRWRGRSRWRAASALADTGRVRAFIATSMTAAIARMPFLDTRAI